MWLLRLYIIQLLVVLQVTEGTALLEDLFEPLLDLCSAENVSTSRLICKYMLKFYLACKLKLDMPLIIYA